AWTAYLARKGSANPPPSSSSSSPRLRLPRRCPAAAARVALRPTSFVRGVSLASPAVFLSLITSHSVCQSQQSLHCPHCRVRSLSFPSFQYIDIPLFF